MKEQDFVPLVSSMRQAQKQYFKYRTPEDYRKARELEKQVDTAIKNHMRTPAHPQGSLL